MRKPDFAAIFFAMVGIVAGAILVWTLCPQPIGDMICVIPGIAAFLSGGIVGAFIKITLG